MNQQQAATFVVAFVFDIFCMCNCFVIEMKLKRHCRKIEM